MKSAVLLCAVVVTAWAKPNGYYHQEYNYRTSSSSYKNHELQHRNDDEGFYSKAGDLEGRFQPRVNAHSQHSEYVNPKAQHGYRMGTDRTSSFGQLNAQDRFRLAEPGFEGPDVGGAFGQNYGGISSDLRQVTATLQQEMERELQNAVFDHYQRTAAYGGSITQAQVEADRRSLEEELRRNMTMRLQEALKLHYGNQGIRGAYSYSIINGRLQPTANYHNQELADLTRQMEQNLFRHLNRQVQTYYTRVDTQVHSQRNTYRRVNGVDDNYPSNLEHRPVYQPYPQPVQPVQPAPMRPPPPHPVAPIPDSITTVATRVQTEINEILNKLLEDTQRRYFSENSFQAGVDYDRVLAHLQDELRANITFHLDDQIKRTYGYSNYASRFSTEDIENLRRQIETNLVTKLNRDFNRQREKFFQSHRMYVVQPVPGNQVYYPVNVQTSNYQRDLAEMQRQLQEQMSRQVQTALMQHSYRQAHMYSGAAASVNPQAHYQATLDQLAAELNRNLTRQWETLNLQQYQHQNAAYASQLANMRTQLQSDLMRQLQQGLQQSYSRYSSWSASSSSSSSSNANYRPVRGYDPNLYRVYGASNQGQGAGEDCMMGDDPSVYQQQSDEDLTQQVQDLTQQSQDDADLTQQSEDLTQQAQDLTQQEEDQNLTQQSEDLTQQTQNSRQRLRPGQYGSRRRDHDDLTQQSQQEDDSDLTQQSEDLTQQTQDLLQQEIDHGQQLAQTQTSRQLVKPERYRSQHRNDLLQTQQQTQNHDDLTQQSQDLTQQEDDRDLTQQSEDLTQQSQDLTQQSEDLTQQAQDLTQQSEDLTQQQQTPISRQLLKPGRYGSRRRNSWSQSQQETQNHDDLTQQNQDLTQQSEDLTQQSEDLTQQAQDLTQQNEDLNQQQQTQISRQLLKPGRYGSRRRNSHDDLTQQSQDLTQQSEDLTQQDDRDLTQQTEDLTQQAQDLTEQTQTTRQLLKPGRYRYQQQAEDLTQESPTQDELDEQPQTQVVIGAPATADVPPEQKYVGVIQQRPETQQTVQTTDDIEPIYHRHTAHHLYSQAQQRPEVPVQTQQQTQQITPWRAAPIRVDGYREEPQTQQSQAVDPFYQQTVTQTRPNVYRSHRYQTHEYRRQYESPRQYTTVYTWTQRRPQGNRVGQTVDYYENLQRQRYPQQSYASVVAPPKPVPQPIGQQTDQSQDLLGQQIEDDSLTQQVHNPGFGKLIIGDHRQQNQAQQVEGYGQQTQDLTQQTQDLTQQTQDTDFAPLQLGSGSQIRENSHYATAPLHKPGQIESLDQQIQGNKLTQQQAQVFTDQQNEDATQQNQDLTQQTQDLAQQVQDLSQQNQYLTQQTQDLTHHNQDLAQYTQDLTQQRQDLRQHNQYLAQQTQQLSQQNHDLTQQTEDLTQQNPDLNQQSQDLTQQTEDLLQQEVGDHQQQLAQQQQNQHLTQQTQDLTQQTQDLTQQTEDLTQPQRNQYQTQQTQDFTRQTEDINQPIEPQVASNQIFRDEPPQLAQQTHDLIQQEIGHNQQLAQQQQNQYLTQQTEDLTRQNQDLTQQSEDLTQQSQDLTQQSEDLTQQSPDLTQQSEDLTQQSQDFTQQSQDLTQQTTESTTISALLQQSEDDQVNQQTQQQGLSNAEKESQRLIDLLRNQQRNQQQNQQTQQLYNGPLQNSPSPVYGSIDGHPVQVGTTRQIQPPGYVSQQFQELEPIQPRQFKTRPAYSNTYGQQHQVGTTPELNYAKVEVGEPQHVETVEDTKPIEPQVANEVQQVGEDVAPVKPEEDEGATTPKPGWWSRFKSNVRNKIG